MSYEGTGMSMKDKILNALKEISEEVISMSDEEFKVIIDMNKDGQYSKILKEICFTSSFDLESEFINGEKLMFDNSKKYSQEELKWITSLYNLKNDDSFPMAA
jgi:hypothetical protein